LACGEFEEDAISLIDQATIFFEIGDHTHAAANARASLALCDRPRWKGAAHLLLARITHDPVHVKDAERLLMPLRTYDKLALAYCRTLVDPEAAETHLRRALALAQDLSPFDTVFVELDLAKLLADRGKLAQAGEEVRRTVQLLALLRQYPGACEALLRLFRCGQRLTAQAIATTKVAVEKARLAV
jgi:tetratricopeptide (TPR) repeat protein